MASGGTVQPRASQFRTIVDFGIAFSTRQTPEEKKKTRERKYCTDTPPFASNGRLYQARARARTHDLGIEFVCEAENGIFNSCAFNSS